MTVSAPEAFGRLGRYQALRQLMVKDPEKAQGMIDQFDDFKVPFYIHASIHGTEYPGVDAAINLIKTLAFEDSEEVRTILNNVILLVYVVANPDGRVLGTRGNVLGFDLNRDFITQSQPETRAAVRIFTQWNPMVVLDLHGFATPMLIEPCTPPHNPNYEYDLYIKWALAQAEAMEAELYAHTVNFLLFNDAQVEQASEAFKLNGVTYPKGTYIVWMDQPKRGLANTVLWDGWDISYDPGLDMYDISGWSHPLLWGVSRAIVEDELYIQTCTINRADGPKGFVEGGRAGAYAYLPTCNEAIKATNELLARGITLYRAKQPFVDSGRTFGTGTFIIPADQASAKAVANELATKYGLRVYALRAIPNNVSLMRRQCIAVHADEGVRFFLKEFGFDFTIVTTSDLNRGIDLSGYDIFIHSGWSYLWTALTSTGRSTLLSFFGRGGHYIGIGRSGAHLNVQAGLLTVTYKFGKSNDNGILMVTYEPADPVAAQYPVNSHAFVYGPVWFTDYAGLTVSAYVKEGEFFVSGFWDEWKTSGAGGKPIVLHGVKGPSIVTLMGINPTFRAHPEHTFRVLANAIYQTLG